MRDVTITLPDNSVSALEIRAAIRIMGGLCIQCQSSRAVSKRASYCRACLKIIKKPVVLR